MESKKTGKKFIFESEIQNILEGDPALKPVVMKSSFGANEINNNVGYTDDEIGDNDDEETAVQVHQGRQLLIQTRNPKERRGKQRKVDELKEYLTERDQEFLKRMNVMNVMKEKTSAILEKLVEKL